MEFLIKQLLIHIGEDPQREGLVDTPRRVAKMYSEIFKGYDPKQAPKVSVFPNGKDGITYDQMIIDTGEFYSHCEHHMIPFFGQYWFAYIPKPDGYIIGLSKIARIVDYYSARLQTQERLVRMIVDAIETELGSGPPLGMALIMKGEHLCKTMRGIKKKGQMTTSYMTGVFKKVEVKNELLSLIR